MPRRRWSGPPRLLLLATVVLYGVAVATSQAGVSLPIGDTAQLTANELSSTPTSTPDPTADETEQADPSTSPSASPSTSPSASPSASSETRPDEARGRTESAQPRHAAEQTAKHPSRRIGVASFNAYRQLSLAQTIEDARDLARRDWVDIIGWQEAYRMGGVRPALRKLGWRTEWAPGGADELAVSWRTDQFRFVRSDRRRVAPGVAPNHEHPVSDRYVLRVVLQDRATQRTLSVVTTHLPQAIESEGRPGRWRATPNAERARNQLAAVAEVFDNSPGRWVLGAGDMNFDVRSERRAHPRGGPTRALRGRATSSYQALGSKGLLTHPVSGRNIDYVYAATPAVKQQRVEFLKHLTVGGLHSDHRPLLARLKLN